MNQRRETVVQWFVCLILVGAVAALAGCKKRQQKGQDFIVKSQVDQKANLQGYKTYAWIQPEGAVNDPNNRWLPRGYDIDKELRFLIDKELQERGMTFAASDPDAYVTYVVVVDMDAQASELKQVYGDKADLDNLAEGAILIGLVDPESAKVVWAGSARSQVDRKRTDEDSKKNLAKAVDLIFDRYGK